jgi:DNA invertase Pin-like site-specific DNA recombinase
MTRSQRAKSNTINREKEMRKKVMMVTTGMFANDYRKKNGKFNMTLIAKESGLHRDTVKRHIAQLIDEKILVEAIK